MGTILDGKATAEILYTEMSQQVAHWRVQMDKVPHLAIILLGDNPASHAYVQTKLRACRRVGFEATLIQHTTLSEIELLKIIDQLNDDPVVDGIIVQLPLPEHIDTERVISHVAPQKDVDGLSPVNCGRLMCHLPGHVPATPKGIIKLLEHYQISTQGQHCVIVGRSRTVGLPLSVLLSSASPQGNATVTVCHSHTQHLPDFTKQADILVVAVGCPGLIRANMVKEGAVVVDVGITRVTNAPTKTGLQLKGDVAFDEVAPYCSYITPVPGGVGPMTVAALLHNTLQAAQQK